MAKRSTPAQRGAAKSDLRPQVGEVGADGELVRDSGKKADAPEIKVVHAEQSQAPDKKPVGAEPDLNEKLAGLEREMAATKRRAEEAERRATEAERVAAERGKVADTNEDAAFRNHKTAIANAATAAKGDLSAAKRAYTTAMEAGDFSAAAEAQEAIAEAKTKQMGIDAEQQRIEAWEKRPKAEKQPETRQAATPREAVDVRAMPRAARDYLDDHPELLDDWKLWNRLTRAHGDALDDGIEAYSDEYFDKYIHPRMGTGEGERRPAPRGRSGDGAMPPSRSGPANPGTRNASEVSLSQREVEAAHFSYPELSHEDAEVAYAQNKLALIKDGRIGTKH